ncbi:MAG: hypothetical protein HPPSJP_0990 [Candidatus Hepatoplasma scabrum]|nr:MAG: hypothetical protein HPPSJP_0990 [Candidatus Hepatoplasma sp.]
MKNKIITDEKNNILNNSEKNFNQNEEKNNWNKIFKKKFLIILSLVFIAIIIIISLSLTLTNKNKDKSNVFYAYGSDCPYIINYSEEYVGYGRIGLEICFELDPKYVADDHISVYEIPNDANQEPIFIKEYPLEYTTYDDGLYPNGLYNTYQYVPYNLSDHNENYSVQVDIMDKSSSDYIGTAEIEKLTLYNNRKPNGFTIKNVKDYGDCYMEYDIFYPEGSGRIEEVYLEDQFGNVLSTSKPITSPYFHYDYRGFLYLPPNYTSEPQTYRIYAKYSHNITSYGRITQEYQILLDDEIIVLPFDPN